MPTVPDPLTLDTAWADAWQRLAAGVTDRDSPFHHGVLASIGAGGPEARTVVLRFADAATGVVGCHTDVRSPKWAELQADPRASWVFVGDGVQVRVQGTVHCHHDDAIADAAWAATGRFGRRCYLAVAAPGTPWDSPTTGLPETVHEAPPDDPREDGRTQFGVIRLHIARLDWLHLQARGHRRAVFQRVGAGWDGQWRIP